MQLKSEPFFFVLVNFVVQLQHFGHSTNICKCSYWKSDFSFNFLFGFLLNSIISLKCIQQNKTVDRQHGTVWSLEINLKWITVKNKKHESGISSALNRSNEHILQQISQHTRFMNQKRRKTEAKNIKKWKSLWKVENFHFHATMIVVEIYCLFVIKKGRKFYDLMVLEKSIFWHKL